LHGRSKLRGINPNAIEQGMGSRNGTPGKARQVYYQREFEWDFQGDEPPLLVACGVATPHAK